MTSTPQTMPDIVYAKVLEGIIDGTIPAGTQLIDRKLAADFDVSRTPVREALSRLAKEGREPLNAVVLTLAMLSPMTDMAQELALRPEMPAYKEPIIISPPKVY